MPYPKSHIIINCALLALVSLFIGLPLGTFHSAFAKTPTDPDIYMTFDPSQSFYDDAEMLNNFLNVFTAAYLATDGNLEVVVLDRHTICLSPRRGSCTSKAPSPNRHVATEVDKKKFLMQIPVAFE